MGRCENPEVVAPADNQVAEAAPGGKMGASETAEVASSAGF